ncbi:hypothetical protein Tco_0930644, partial [Tanacetum coccineum]
MANPKFVDTHNMVAFLSKPTESDRFEQIVDFLNAQPIRYALTVNPTIYISLALNNSGLLAWSKLSMGNMVRNLDNLYGKFLMYPRFVQVLLNQQLDGLPTHKRIYNAPSHTKKIFGNMRRVGKGFSGRVTPLFPTMVVQNQAELGEASTIPTDPHHTPTIIESSSQPQKIQKPRKPRRKDTQLPQPIDPVSKLSDDSLLARGNTLRSDGDILKLNELMELC